MGDPSAVLEKLRLDSNNNSQSTHFKKVKTLGSGAFGCVELCSVEEGKSYAKKGDLVAVKSFINVSDQEMAKKEAMVLHELDHKYIVRYMDNFKDNKGQLSIVMEYCDRGTLEDYLSSIQVKPCPEFWIWRFVGQFSSALSFLHGQHPPILHNDLKPANILCKTQPEPGVDGEIKIKISDFGVCNVLGKSRLSLPIVSDILILR